HWCLRGPGTETDVGVRLAAAIWLYWYFRGRPEEGRVLLEAALVHAAGADAVRAELLCGAGAMAQMQGQRELAIHFLEQSIGLWRLLGDRRGLAMAAKHYSFCLMAKHEHHMDEGARQEIARAQDALEESAAYLRQTGDAWNLAQTLVALARA